MRTKLILAGAAIALAASISPAAADEAQFSIFEGIPATPMTQGEMAEVVGSGVPTLVTGLRSPQGTHTVNGPLQSLGGAVTAFTNVSVKGAALEATSNLAFSVPC